MRDLVGHGGTPPVVRWPDGARIAVSLVVQFEEGAERCPLDGDAYPESDTEALAVEGKRRDLHVESMYEYGARAGIWRLLDLLDRHEVKATFFCCGRALERNPVAAREISARGHEPCGHGYRWVPYPDLSRAAQKADISKAIQAIEATTGQRPVGWNSRVPAAETRELLMDEGGFIYDSDSYDDDLPHLVGIGENRLLTIPYTSEVSDEKFWAKPGMAGFVNPENFYHLMKESFDRLYEEGATHPKMMSIGLRPRIGGRPPRALQVDRFLAYAKGFPDVWFARRADIARWWLEHSAHIA